MVARAPAPVWEVKQGVNGKIAKLLKKRAFVNHYSLHVRDPQWGHLTIKMSSHPPFGAHVILNGHEYVACQAHLDGLGYAKRTTTSPASPTPPPWLRPQTTCPSRRLSGGWPRFARAWIYSACLIFGLDLDEQTPSRFNYSYSVYQVECSQIGRAHV